MIFYNDIAGAIPLAVEHTITMGMYEIHRHDLIETLVTNAECFRDKILSKMTNDYQTVCKQLVFLKTIVDFICFNFF